MKKLTTHSVLFTYRYVCVCVQYSVCVCVSALFAYWYACVCVYYSVCVCVCLWVPEPQWIRMHASVSEQASVQVEQDQKGERKSTEKETEETH